MFLREQTRRLDELVQIPNATWAATGRISADTVQRTKPPLSQPYKPVPMEDRVERHLPRQI